MNGWFLLALVMIVVAVLIVIGTIIVILSPVKKTVTILLAHGMNIKKQITDLQTEVVALTGTIDRINQDVQFKKESIQSVVTNVRGIGMTVVDLKDSSRQTTMAVVKKTNQDERKNEQVEQWKNTALRILKRNA